MIVANDFIVLAVIYAILLAFCITFGVQANTARRRCYRFEAQNDRLQEELHNLIGSSFQQKPPPPAPPPTKPPTKAEIDTMIQDLMTWRRQLGE